MDRSLPPSAAASLDFNSRVFAPALIQEIDPPVRKRRPHKTRKRIDNAAELTLHRGSFVAGTRPTMRHSID
jgi:hypothetical protein